MLTSVLCAALAAAPVDGGAARAPFEWNVPQVDRVVEVGDRLEAKGLPLKIYLVHTALPMRDAFRHYYDRFQAEGFFVDPNQKVLPGLSLLRLTAFDEKSLWSYTVIFYPETNGGTTLTLGAADLHPRRAGAPAASSPMLPVVPGAKFVLTSNVEFGRSLSFETDQSSDEVLSYYQATLPALGWKEREKGNFLKGGQRLRLLTRPTGKTLQVVLLQDPDLALPGP